MKDLWTNRTEYRRCKTCQFVCEKEKSVNESAQKVARCRRHAPTINGYPLVYPDDWCGDWKLDENKI